ncbi:MAG: hypothetical protein ACOZCL_17330 [Bacillota bacterium]
MKDIDFKDNIVKRNKIPILIYTPEWIQLFSNFRNKNMNKAADELEKLLAREKGCESEIEALEKRKKLVMNKILHISKDINENNNKAAVQKMDEAQKELLYINEKIPLLIEELETLPSKINMQNTLLLKATIKRAYELINDNKLDSEKCQQELVVIRQKLGALIQRKVELDERVNKLYSFIHGILGSTEMEKLDESFLDE